MWNVDICLLSTGLIQKNGWLLTLALHTWIRYVPWGKGLEPYPSSPTLRFYPAYLHNRPLFALCIHNGIPHDPRVRPSARTIPCVTSSSQHVCWIPSRQLGPFLCIRPSSWVLYTRFSSLLFSSLFFSFLLFPSCSFQRGLALPFPSLSFSFLSPPRELASRYRALCICRPLRRLFRFSYFLFFFLENV